MPSRIELLVHVSAPSLGQNDTRYRTEANAFLQYVPGERLDVIGAIDAAHEIDVGAVECAEWNDTESFLLPTASPSTNDATESMTSVGPTQRVEAIRDLFQYRFKDVTPGQTPASRGLLRTPVALNVASPALPWTSVKETPHLLIERTPAIPRPQTAPNAETPSGPSRTFRRSHSDSWQTPPSMIPNSQPSQESTGPQISSSPILKRPWISISPSEDRDPSPTAKRRWQRSPSPLPEPSSTATSSNQSLSQRMMPLGPSSSQQSAHTQESETMLPLEIRPKSSPSVGNNKFTTHLTIALFKLSKDPDLEKAQIECPLSRPVKKFERGHWRVPLSTWSKEAKTYLWKTLTDFIGRNKAGWGVWCIREMEDKAKSDSSDKENQSPSQEEVLNVFCWGEIIREVFLVLYVGGVNGKKTRSTQAKWIDAGGHVVAAVKGRYLHE